MQSAQESDLAPLFGDLSQSEKLSEIKPPSQDMPSSKLLQASFRYVKGSVFVAGTV